MSEIKSKKPYEILTVGDDDYKLKFSAGSAVETEKRLKCSLIEATAKIDSITVQIALLHGALQKHHHNVTYKDAEEIYEKYLDEGGSILEFAEKMTEVYIASGFMKKEQGEKAVKIINSVNTTA